MKSNTRSLLCARSAPAAEKEGKPVKKHEHADDGAADVYAGEKPREEQPHARGRRILRAGGEKYQQRARGGVVKIADDGGVGGVEVCWKNCDRVCRYYA